MKGKFFGVRGSFPVPGNDTIIYGGNTSCVSFTKETSKGIDRIIIDAGTGCRLCGKEILDNYFQKKEQLDILFLITHLHPDHIQGFPFFGPNYMTNCKIRIAGYETLKKNVGQVLSQTMMPPTFPIEYKDLKSDRSHMVLSDNDTIYSPLGSMRIDTMKSFAPSHPQQGCMYYKITDVETEKSVACIWDLESKAGGDKAVINFARNCDIIIHDTQYTKDEYNSDKMIVQGYGHSTYEMAIENTIAANCKNLICFHYNPTHTDKVLSEIIDNTYAKIANPSFKMFMAREGWEFDTEKI